MINYLFCPFYYKGKIKDQKEMKSALVPYFEKQYEKEPSNSPTGWMCDVHTSYCKTDLILEKYKKNYTDNIIDFFSEINFPESKLEILNLWYNLYKKGQWQETHHHAANPYAYFSAVHFLKYDSEIHSPIIMSNPNRIFLETYSLGRQTNLNYWDLMHPVNVEEGDIIIFPSTLEHFVKPQVTDDSRITISFNIRSLPIDHI